MILRNWKHGPGVLGGFLAGLAMSGHPLYVFAIGLGLGFAVAFTAKLAVRLVRRLDRALPGHRLTEPQFRRLAAEPLSSDPAYLDGIEAGMRAARRSAGHEDGRIIEADRIAGRDTP